MKKKKIYFIIVVITIALIGLVGIQLYWINNAVKIKESRFRQSVNEAITNVIYRLEKIETARLVKKRMDLYRQLPQLIPESDSLEGIYYRNSWLYSNQYANDSIYNYSKENLKFGYKDGGTGNVIKEIDTTIEHFGKRSAYEEYNTETLAKQGEKKQLLSDPPQNKKIQQSLRNRSMIIQDIFNDMMNLDKRRYIEKRVEPGLLDSLIKAELKNHGISTKFEYGLFSAMRNSLVYEKTGEYTKELMDESYSFVMFPNDLFNAANYLLLYFPNKKQFLLTQMWILLLVSAVLIIVIILSFVLTINTIFRQKKLSEMKNDFINNMTHEFKTPISTISLTCEALNDEDVKKSDELYKNYINVIGDENKRLGILAEKVLQTSIMDKASFKLKQDKLDVKKIIQDVIKGVKIQVEKKGGVVKTDFNTDNIHIIGDKVHISNVFYNLLDNAVKYSRDKPQITVTLENGKNGYWMAAVSDNGIGINKNEQKKIFEKLYRVSTGNIHNVKGFGLGLSYVKTIVEKHDGNISLESEPNKGTIVKVYLPKYNEQ